MKGYLVGLWHDFLKGWSCRPLFSVDCIQSISPKRGHQASNQKLSSTLVTLWKYNEEDDMNKNLLVLKMANTKKIPQGTLFWVPVCRLWRRLHGKRDPNDFRMPGVYLVVRKYANYCFESFSSKCKKEDPKFPPKYSNFGCFHISP